MLYEIQHVNTSVSSMKNIRLEIKQTIRACIEMISSGWFFNWATSSPFDKSQCPYADLQFSKNNEILIVSQTFLALLWNKWEKQIFWMLFILFIMHSGALMETFAISRVWYSDKTILSNSFFRKTNFCNNINFLLLFFWMTYVWIAGFSIK